MKPLPQDHRIKYMDGSKDTFELAINLTPMRAIRLKCIDCSGGSRNEVAACLVADCPLYPFRMNRKPTYDGVEVKRRILTDEQKVALRERLRQGNHRQMPQNLATPSE